MNRLISTLAGLALVAASVAPAMAQGNLFSPPGTFTFTDGGTFNASGTGETYNPTGSAAAITPVSFTLSGTKVGSSLFYDLTSLSITGNGVNGAGLTTFTETGPLQFLFATSTTGVSTIASVGAAADGTTFNLVAAPVPEASTTAAFGLLLVLGLGGLMIAAKRKKSDSTAV